jgi:hypothetical protein
MLLPGQALNFVALESCADVITGHASAAVVRELSSLVRPKSGDIVPDLQDLRRYYPQVNDRPPALGPIFATLHLALGRYSVRTAPNIQGYAPSGSSLGRRLQQPLECKEVDTAPAHYCCGA